MKKSIISLIIILAGLGLFVSCDNFLDGSGLKSTLDEHIDYAGASTHLEVVRVSPDFKVEGVSKSFKISVSFNMSVNASTCKYSVTSSAGKEGDWTEYYNSSWIDGDKVLVLSPKTDEIRIENSLEDLTVKIPGNTKSKSGRILGLEDYSFTVRINSQLDRTAPLWTKTDFTFGENSSLFNTDEQFQNNFKNWDAEEYKNRHCSRVKFDFSVYDGGDGVNLKVTEKLLQKVNGSIDVEDVAPVENTIELTADANSSGYFCLPEDYYYSFLDGKNHLVEDGVILLSVQIVDASGNEGEVRSIEVVKDTFINTAAIRFFNNTICSDWENGYRTFYLAGVCPDWWATVYKDGTELVSQFADDDGNPSDKLKFYYGKDLNSLKDPIGFIKYQNPMWQDAQENMCLEEMLELSKDEMKTETLCILSVEDDAGVKCTLQKIMPPATRCLELSFDSSGSQSVNLKNAVLSSVSSDNGEISIMYDCFYSGTDKTDSNYLNGIYNVSSEWESNLSSIVPLTKNTEVYVDSAFYVAGQVHYMYPSGEDIYGPVDPDDVITTADGLFKAGTSGSSSEIISVQCVSDGKNSGTHTVTVTASDPSDENATVLYHVHYKDSSGSDVDYYYETNSFQLKSLIKYDVSVIYQNKVTGEKNETSVVEADASEDNCAPVICRNAIFKDGFWSQDEGTEGFFQNYVYEDSWKENDVVELKIYYAPYRSEWNGDMNVLDSGYITQNLPYFKIKQSVNSDKTVSPVLPFLGEGAFIYFVEVVDAKKNYALGVFGAGYSETLKTIPVVTKESAGKIKIDCSADSGKDCVYYRYEVFNGSKWIPETVYDEIKKWHFNRYNEFSSDKTIIKTPGENKFVKVLSYGKNNMTGRYAYFDNPALDDSDSAPSFNEWTGHYYAYGQQSDGKFYSTGRDEAYSEPVYVYTGDSQCSVKSFVDNDSTLTPVVICDKPCIVELAASPVSFKQGSSEWNRFAVKKDALQIDPEGSGVYGYDLQSKLDLLESGWYYCLVVHFADGSCVMGPVRYKN